MHLQYFSRLAPRETKCPHITAAEAQKKMASIKEQFKEDIAHYSKHGLLYLESGPYDIDEKSAQELMNRHDRMSKLQKELEERKDSWPDIFKGNPVLYFRSHVLGFYSLCYFSLSYPNTGLPQWGFCQRLLKSVWPEMQGENVTYVN